MKKFLVILLSLGLIVAFGASASATSVKFSGTYYVAGVYDDNRTFVDGDMGTSRAFFYQRVRIQPVFQVAEGLTFTARMDAMEKQWGNTNFRGGTDDKNSSRRMTPSSGNPKIQESFEWERSYVSFKTAAGQVSAGFMASGAWATDFGNDTQSRPRIRFDSAAGPVKYGIVYEKEFDADTHSTLAGNNDADRDTLALYGIYNWKGGNAGLLYKFYNRADTRPTANFRGKFHALLPYIKATFGPVYMEAEVVYMFGKAREYDSGTSPDIDIDGLGAYLKVQGNFGPAYVGVKGHYSQGDDNAADTTAKTGPSSQDMDYGLMLGNDAMQTYTTVANGGANGTTFDSGKTNSMMYSLYGGFKVSPKLKMEAMIVSGQVDQVAANVDKSLGVEVDLTATYKIYDNLSYMVGGAYLWTGDYFKGVNPAGANKSVSNDYLLINKLSLSF